MTPSMKAVAAAAVRATFTTMCTNTVKAAAAAVAVTVKATVTEAAVVTDNPYLNRTKKAHSDGCAFFIPAVYQ